MPSGSRPGYTHVVEATTPARIVYIAGQLGTDKDGKLSANFRQQAVQTFENLKHALAAVGGRVEHVVKFNNYLVDLKYLPIFRQVQRQLPIRPEPAREHNARDLRAGARGRAPRDRGCRGAAASHRSESRLQAGIQSKEQGACYQSLPVTTKVMHARHSPGGPGVYIGPSYDNGE
jgi:enamine deaminase RidA (YjgF/YER057c/UK114 family)